MVIRYRCRVCGIAQIGQTRWEITFASGVEYLCSRCWLWADAILSTIGVHYGHTTLT